MYHLAIHIPTEYSCSLQLCAFICQAIYSFCSDKRKDAIKEEREQAEKEPEPEVKKEPTARDLELARLLKEEEERQGEPDLDFDPVWSLKRAQIEKPSRQCPYLDTIDRLFLVVELICKSVISHDKRAFEIKRHDIFISLIIREHIRRCVD